jgi:PAS domain S-box-containing protein
MDIYSHPSFQKYIKTCPAGEVIMTEGEEAKDLYILIEGHLDVIKGGKKIHEIKSPGAYFGELSFLLGTVRIASIITATENTKYLCLPSKEVDDIWQQVPEFARHLAENLAQRLHETTNVAQGFREFCDSMPDAVIMTNADCEVLSWNRAAENLYGRSWHQMRGKSIEEIYDNQASFKQFMAELDQHGSIKEKGLKVNHPEKDWFFVSTSTTILKDPSDNTQGYLFLGRDATSLQQLEQKQKKLKKSLIPLVVILSALTGWLCWQNFTTAPQWTYVDPEDPSCEHIISRLNRDTATMQLALRSPLAGQDRKAARKVLSDYFADFQPEFAGINGVTILDGNEKILCSYLPAFPGTSKLEGESYTGSKFAEDIFNRNRNMEIFLVSRPEDAGGPGVEITVNLKDRPTRLAYRLDMELIKLKYGCDINGLAKVINP